MRAISTSHGLIPAVVLAAAVTVPIGAEAQNPEAFTSDIRPIMEQRCWNCHGEQLQLSGLDLRTRERALTGGTRGPAIVPGRADESLLFRLVAGLEEPSMPGEGTLTEVEIASVRAWIEDGAHWDTGPATTGDDEFAVNTELPPGARDYWAFQLPVQGPLPDAPAFEHPIDRFLQQTRRAAGLTAAPRADQLTLLRRAHLDLTGLPPTPEETAQFVADTGPGARLIDRLLASPHYGERWGRHWLEVARYADSDGFEQDVDRPNAWRYRDYVIDAFNQDKPYDQFLLEQIAGDELDETTHETRIATGFLRAGPRVNFREKDNPERRYDYLDECAESLFS